MDLSKISTEQRNTRTKSIDKISTLAMVKLINSEDKKVAEAVETQSKPISKIIDKGIDVINNGGRIVYIGAGTSGRLGILDASEILPTYGEAGLFIGLIAGGKKAIETPVENAEDNTEFAIQDLKEIKFSKKDMLIGVAASGRTPYVISALEHAKKLGAITASISTSKGAKISNIADIPVEAVVGPEVITGSTRMKSGTAQKLILNIISSGIMVKYNKVYSNLMVDIKATNLKLVERATQMIMTITDCSYDEASDLFKKSKNNVKIACVMYVKKLNRKDAVALLNKNNNNLRKVID